MLEKDIKLMELNMEENELLKKNQELEQRVAELEREIAIIKQINQSETVKKYIASVERTRKIARLLDISSEKNISLVKVVDRYSDENISQKCSNILQIKGLESAKEYVSSINTIVTEEMDFHKRIIEDFDYEHNFAFSEMDGYIQIDAYIGFDDEEILIPEEINSLTVKVIGEGAFENCKFLKRVILPSGLERILNKAFCFSGIEEIDLPPNIKFIGDDAFCLSKLNKLRLPESLEIIGKRAFANTRIQSISIPGNIKCVSEGAFKSCRLESIKIQKGVELIEKYAFDWCNIKKLDIPKGVRFLGTHSFYYNAGKDDGEAQKVHVRIPDSVIEMEGGDNLLEGIFGFGVGDKGIIYCNAGSCAMNYARENRIQVKRYEEFDLIEG